MACLTHTCETLSCCRPTGEWNDEDFDVLASGEVVGRIYKANAAPVGSPWMWACRPLANPRLC